eukprot:1158620-Pelagomonas_calceolata.AAC.4
MIPARRWLIGSQLFNCDKFCNSSMNHGVLCTASRDEKPGTRCWCNEEQGPKPYNSLKGIAYACLWCMAWFGLSP